MHDHISIVYNSKRSTGMKLILVLFESYRVEDFFGFKKETFAYLPIWYTFCNLYNWGDFDSINICTRASCNSDFYLQLLFVCLTWYMFLMVC